MYPDKYHHSQGQQQHNKAQGTIAGDLERPNVRYQEAITAVKKQEERAIFTQPTPKPPRRIMLYDQDNKKMLFPLVNDRDVGIEPKYQKIVIESVPLQAFSTTTTTSRPLALRCATE